LPILRSKDLVNWRLIGHALPRLRPEDVFRTPQHGKGVWAPAIRYHDGRFWIYFPDPDAGIYVTTARDPAGPWSGPVLVKSGKGLIDPCPLWDDDGRVYLVHAWARSRAGFANVITLNRLSADGLRALDEGRVVINGDALAGYTTLEGPKIYKRNGVYWIFAPAGGVQRGWQSAFRARRIEGPYDDRIVMRQGASDINGPHQGAWVETPGGEGWFVHFQDLDAYGRVVHLQRLTWRADGWPVIGEDTDGDGTGEPLRRWRKPNVGAGPFSLETPETSDEFDDATLGLQWQWQANPAPDWFSLTSNPGALRLFAHAGADTLRGVPNLLLQKWAAPSFQVTASLRFHPAGDGDRAGLTVFGRDYRWIGLRQAREGIDLVVASGAEATPGADVVEVITRLPAAAVQLRLVVLDGARCQFAYSTDGRMFAPVGAAFIAKPGVWVGAKTGLFALRGGVSTGRSYADWDWFRVEPASATGGR
jgi:beta-xylosidase